MPFMNLKGNWSQRNQRRDMFWTDQHGRKYAGTIETKSGHPTGLVQPQFAAPLMPDRAYFEFVDDDPHALRINYTRWKADIRTANAERDRYGRQIARKLEGSAYNASKPFSAEVAEIIGPAPDPIEPVIAAEQGNRWILGLTTKVDPRLEQYIEPVSSELDEPDFSDEPDLSDLDELVDPDASGGKRIAVKAPAGKGKQPRQGKEESLSKL